jgi:hypothetical protein
MLAVVNNVGIIRVAVCIFQLNNVFDGCYCIASVLGRAMFVTVKVERGWI